MKLENDSSSAPRENVTAYLLGIIVARAPR